MLKYKILTLFGLIYGKKAIDIQANIPERIGVLLGWKVFTDKYGIKVWAKNKKDFILHEQLR